MSYHDGYNPHMEGIAVVNPLLEQRKRLTQLEQFLLEIVEETDDAALKTRIEQILKSE